jgi:hypothetical protein
LKLLGQRTELTHTSVGCHRSQERKVGGTLSSALVRVFQLAERALLQTGACKPAQLLKQLARFVRPEGALDPEGANGFFADLSQHVPVHALAYQQMLGNNNTTELARREGEIRTRGTR